MTDGLALRVGRVLAGGVAAGCLALALWIIAGRAGWLELEPGAAEPVSASFMAENFTCRRGETRTIERLGIEDGYATDNLEPARFDRAGSQRITGVGLRRYDEAGPDRDFLDYFQPPRDAVSGLLIIRMTSRDDDSNDTITIGDFPAERSRAPHVYAPTFRSSLQALRANPDWSVSGDIHSVPLERIMLEAGIGLLDHVRDPSGDGIVDIVISDDTSVDFMAMATCSPPAAGTGMAFWHLPLLTAPGELSGAVRATCYAPPRDEPFCDPFVGDTPCDTALPLACYRAGDASFPASLSGTPSEQNARFWIGGELRLTTPLPADRFDSIEEANAFCRAEFGEDWRVADFHLSGRGFDIQAIGPSQYQGRVWLDIRDQPYATCWARE
jgi:hypothetical protein